MCLGVIVAEVTPELADGLYKATGGDIAGEPIEHPFNWWCNGLKPDGSRKFPAAPKGIFWASGHNNNKCFVIPEWDMVIVRLGLDGKAKDDVWNGFLGKVGKALKGSVQP